MFTLNCAGNLLIIDKPIIMGIINATPDSFYKGDLDTNVIKIAAQMIQEGATILDIGGQSTKPNSVQISAKEEAKRVIPFINKIKKAFPNVLISVDTFYADVAQEAIDNGATIINDISCGSFDKNILHIAAKNKTPYVCMHMQGTPATMQAKPTYINLTKEILDFFIHKIDECKQQGILDIIIDPGFGFGKTVEHNFTLLRHLSIFNMLEKPILAGLSRKSMIYKTLNTTAEFSLNGTTALNMLALQNGATILRVHDVKEANETILLFEKLKTA